MRLHNGPVCWRRKNLRDRKLEMNDYLLISMARGYRRAVNGNRDLEHEEKHLLTIDKRFL